MEIAVEISLYPLDAAYIPPIQDFIGRLNAVTGLKVVTTSLSTQIFGEYEEVLGALAREMRTTFAEVDKSVFVLKVIGPLAPPGRAA
jgi:uncharacterized protein YqgV (UPF0045/DUF77 family)